MGAATSPSPYPHCCHSSCFYSTQTKVTTTMAILSYLGTPCHTLTCSSPITLSYLVTLILLHSSYYTHLIKRILLHSSCHTHLITIIFCDDPPPALYSLHTLYSSYLTIYVYSAYLFLCLTVSLTIIMTIIIIITTTKPQPKQLQLCLLVYHKKCCQQAGWPTTK